MTRRLVIAVSGKPGTGKTTYAKHLASVFGLRYVSSGELFRRIAEERGLSLLDLHKLAEEDESIDLEVDRRALEEASRGGVVVEGHLAAWVLKDAADLKIIFTAPLEVRAKRVADRDGKPVSEALAEVLAREESNRRRALKYYGLDIEDLSVGSLVLDTSLLDVEGVKKVVETFVREYLRVHPEKR
jgi:cytidylate kinase